MTEAQAVEAIVEAWEDGWGDLHPSDPLDPDYVPFVLDNEAATGVSKWARVTIIETARPQTTSGPEGSRRYEVRGRIAVQLFVDVDQGSLPLAELSDDVRTVLQGKAIAVGSEQIAIFEVAPVGPPTTDGRWSMRTLNAPYMYQQLA